MPSIYDARGSTQEYARCEYARYGYKRLYNFSNFWFICDDSVFEFVMIQREITCKESLYCLFQVKSWESRKIMYSSRGV